MNATRPRYQQLKDLIIRQILNGELQPSDRVPSENELVESMQVSRMTANRALRELNDEGYVERVAGRGTFVADFRSQSHLVEVHNIADEIAARGHRHTSRVLRQSRQHARGEVAKALHVEQGTEIFHLHLVHFENGKPIQVEDRHVLATFAPECIGPKADEVVAAMKTGHVVLLENLRFHAEETLIDSAKMLRSACVESQANAATASSRPSRQPRTLTRKAKPTAPMNAAQVSVCASTWISPTGRSAA